MSYLQDYMKSRYEKLERLYHTDSIFNFLSEESDKGKRSHIRSVSNVPNYFLKRSHLFVGVKYTDTFEKNT